MQGKKFKTKLTYLYKNIYPFWTGGDILNDFKSGPFLINFLIIENSTSFISIHRSIHQIITVLFFVFTPQKLFVIFQGIGQRLGLQKYHPCP